MAASALVVRNESRRRIVNFACQIEPSEGVGLTLAAEQVGTSAEPMNSAPTYLVIEGLTPCGAVPLMRPGASFGFLVRFDLEAHPAARFATRFTDDAGLHWQIAQRSPSAAARGSRRLVARRQHPGPKAVKLARSLPPIRAA